MQGPPPWTSPAVLLPLLEGIEELPADAAGAYVLEERQQTVGLVLVQHGRLCWAVSNRMRGRLTDLLVERCDGRITAGEFDHAYQACRADGKPLGEELVRRGLIGSAGLRSALFRHCCEALLACAASRTRRWSWQALQGPTYDRSFTFAPVEIYVGLTAIQEPERAALARDELRSIVPQGVAAVAYSRAHGLSPLAVYACSPTVTELDELGRWLAGLSDIAAAISTGAEVTLRDQTYAALFTWRSGDVLYLAACDDPSDLGYILAKRAREIR